MLIALIYKERSFFVFLETFLVFLALEALHGWRPKSGYSTAHGDGFLIIVLFWILFSIISAFPLWIDDEFNLSFVDALFEGVSGITTTGATVISDVSTLPFAFLYYRAQLNFIGGLGVIVSRLLYYLY